MKVRRGARRQMRARRSSCESMCSLVVPSVAVAVVIVVAARSPAALRRAARGCARRSHVRLGLLKLLPLALKVCAPLHVLIAIEEQLAVDVGLIDARIDAERVAVPDDEVGILAHVDRA